MMLPNWSVSGGANFPADLSRVVGGRPRPAPAGASTGVANAWDCHDRLELPWVDPAES